MVEFEGVVRVDKHPMIPVTLKMAGKHDVECMGILDTGSPQSFVHFGLLELDWFSNSIEPIGAIDVSKSSVARGTSVVISMRNAEAEVSFDIDVYELQMAAFPPGTCIMLLGRTFLQRGLLTYDGANGKWRFSIQQPGKAAKE